MGRKRLVGVLLAGIWLLTSCGTMGMGGNSESINAREDLAYKQATLRCYKTGGTRVVKIQSILHCF